MKKLKLSLQNMEGVEVLTREQLKKVMGGDGGSGGGCVRVYSTQGYNSCWYSNGDANSLCSRVYGDNCYGTSDGYVDCTGCTMN